MPMKPFLKQVRRFSQVLFLLTFLVLFRLTDYSGQDTIPYAVNIFFRMDPLVAAAVTLATKTWIYLMWPALVVVGLTLVFGRVFCGWLCPLGTLIDGITGWIPKSGRGWVMPWVKYALLFILLISAAFGVQLLGYLDPFSLLVRGMVFAVDPALRFLASSLFDTIYATAPLWLSDITEWVYAVLKSVVLPYQQGFFYLSLLSFSILIFIFCLEWFGKRTWCRNLCPLGALLGLISKVAWMKRLPVKGCAHCGKCSTDCRMDLFDAKNRFKPEECTLCMDCLEYCPDNLATFTFSRPFKYRISMDLTRRQVLAAGFAGMALPVLMKTDAVSKESDGKIIRPPGALPELDFSAVCVRCGECMKVCINNALQPLFLERGLEKMFTPALVPRIGYCEYNCTLCSQVCPTGAIERLDRKQKHVFVMGSAFFDKNRCFVYADKKECIVCEEHCPTHDKAIKFNKSLVLDNTGQKRQLYEPYVVEALCVGCGICEYVCPVQGEAAIRVVGKTQRKIKGGY